MKDDKYRITKLIDFELEHEDDIIYYRKEYANEYKRHDEPSYGYFLLSEAKDEDGEFQEVTTEYTLYINYDNRTDMFSFSEEQDVLSENEVARIVRDTSMRENVTQFAKRFGCNYSLYRINSSEFFDVLSRIL